MSSGSPRPDNEQRRRSAAALFLKVHDLDFDSAEHLRPVVQLCNLMISEGLLAGGDALRILAPYEGRSTIQLHRAGAWVDIMALPSAAQLPLINRLKVMANLDIARHPVQEGTLKVRLRGEDLELAITVRLQGDVEEASLQLPPRAAAGEAAPLAPR